MADASEINKLLTQFTGQVLVSFISELQANVIDETPIDTGFARANWLVSSGFPLTELNGTYEDARQGNVNTAYQEQNLSLLVSQYKFTATNNTLYLVNNVDYITELNMGSSSQAPSAYVQRTIAYTVERFTFGNNN